MLQKKTCSLFLSHYAPVLFHYHNHNSQLWQEKSILLPNHICNREIFRLSYPCIVIARTLWNLCLKILAAFLSNCYSRCNCSSIEEHDTLPFSTGFLLHYFFLQLYFSRPDWSPRPACRTTPISMARLITNNVEAISHMVLFPLCDMCSEKKCCL